jgi:hypothetical protein
VLQALKIKEDKSKLCRTKEIIKIRIEMNAMEGTKN